MPRAVKVLRARWARSEARQKPPEGLVSQANFRPRGSYSHHINGVISTDIMVPGIGARGLAADPLK